MKRRVVLIGIALILWSIVFLSGISIITNSPTTEDVGLFVFVLVVEITLIVFWVRSMNKYHSPAKVEKAQQSSDQIIDQSNEEKEKAGEPKQNITKPNEAKTNKPVYTQWWFWLIIVLCAFNLWIVVAGEDEEPVDDENTTTEKVEATSNQQGSENNPYILNATAWHTAHCEGTSEQKYIDQWVMVSGTVLSISDYGSLKGYYLSGGPGSGLVCWAEGDTISVQYGQQIEYVGKVTVEDSKQIELSDGTIQNVSWPTEKVKSPITISEWTWTRDSAGGVEWDFRFTNNTDKTVKYIVMEWYCYNAVGDLVYDEISRKASHGIKFTGPLEAGKTSDLMCNSTLFYNHSYHTSKLTKLTVEFMDGTVIHINDEAYVDIIQ